jgi:GT2 family glycosyltransferase
MIEKVMPLVSVGIVAWNSAVDLPHCLEALAGQDYPSCELIIVDNASTDHSAELIAQTGLNLKFIRNTTNAGYCYAHNQAIREARGAYYLALNPDVTMAPGYISALVRDLEERPDYGMAGGKLLLQNGVDSEQRIDSTGLFLNRQRRQFLRGHGETDQGQFDKPGEVFGVDGAAPLYKRVMLEDIKIHGEYFDDNFFAHKEDVDLAWRARLFGWRCWYADSAIAYHKRSFRPGIRESVSPAIKVHAIKNRYLLLLKNESKAGWQRDGLQILWYDFKIFFYLCLFERSSLSALGLIRHSWNRALAWRHEIAFRSRVKPHQILCWFK